MFWWVHLIICFLCDWLEWLLWFWFYDTQLKTALDDDLTWFVFLHVLPVIILVPVLISAGEDALRLRGFIFLLACYQIAQISGKKKYSNLNHFRFLVVFCNSPFHCNFARKNLDNINKLDLPNCSAKDQKTDSYCSMISSFHVWYTTCDQLVNINRTTVNLPFSLFSIYYFSNTISVLGFSAIFRLYSFFILSLTGLLVVYDPLHLISTWFALISHRISWNWHFFSNTPNANMADRLVVARIELHESEASEARMFCFHNTSPEKFRRRSGLLYFAVPMSCCVFERCEKG